MARSRLGGYLLLGITLCAAGWLGPAAWGQGKSVISIKTDQAPAIDGVAEALWDKASALQLTLDQTPYEPSNGYKGMKKTKVTIKSLYDAENVYFLVQWADPTQSLQRQPWVKQADGSWKILKNPDSTGHDNTYYEDKMAMFWNINTQNFDPRGCAVVCHKARAGKIAGIEDSSPGRKYTNKAGETLDMWHWKGVRNGSVGQMDDQYVDDTHDPKLNADWGRKSNDKTGGGYSDNINAAKNGPAFMNKNPGEENKFWVLDSDKVPFEDHFKAGDMVPGIVVAPFTGPRGDISAQGKWANGTWTLEIKRTLVTTGANAKTQDVQFSDLSKAYPFGIAVFDNAQINHLFHEGVLKLSFK